ncbi:hypothetical protein [Lysinibacillus sp. JNUCC-52]|uniref:hypothetical protein n=1 Tax=Lysinibacillus sp. JNUCC-52 TaxID=2792480 RepID=UPI00193526EB|nr:hypothetical protein JNUCC52_03050 [Lysinibacillus sp. JNUCC-52]
MDIQGVISVEAKTIKSLMVELEPKYTNGHDYCELIVDESRNGFTARLCNETYSFSWGAPGNDFIQFLIDTFSKNNDYLFGKLEDYSKRDYVDTEKTAKAMKVLLLQARRYNQIDEEQAREIWEEIEYFRGNDEITQNHLYSEWSNWFECAIKQEIFSNEPWFEEFISYNEDWRCRVFCEKVAPILAEVLKVEYELVGVNE